MTYKESDEHKSVLIPISEVYHDKDLNCRQNITPLSVDDLARDIEKNGLYSPILIQPYDKKPGYKYRVISGHRRYQAFKNLKRTELPCIVHYDLSDDQVRVLNLSENISRKDLNVLEEAQAMRHFFERGYTMDDVARLLNMSRGWVQIRFTLLRLPEEIQAEAAAGTISQNHIKELYSLRDKEQQFAAVRRIKDLKARGEKVKSNTVRKIDPTDKRQRTKNEIFKMQDLIRDAVGNNLATRALAWASGIINEHDMLLSIKEHAVEKNIPWVIPADYFDKHD